MSTRATYGFGKTVIYCHYDNYLAGAATRFASMVKAMTQPETDDWAVEAIKRKKGGILFAFIRGNDDAEQTVSHEVHGDTDFRYDLQENTDGSILVTWFERNDDDDFVQKGKMDLADFVNFQREEYAKQLIEFGNRDGKTANIDEIVETVDKLLPLIVRVQQNYGSIGKLNYYATVDDATAITKNFDRMSKLYGKDNPNTATWKRRWGEWFNATKAAIEGMGA